jgi:hypothetical protein
MRVTVPGLRHAPVQPTLEPGFEAAMKKLDADSDFRALVRTDSAAAFLKLFSDPTLPGQSAKDRLDFILWYTHEPKDGPLLHFRSMGGATFTDSGFDPELQDGKLFSDPECSNNQVGHFLTAVDMSRVQNPLNHALYEAAAIGHENLGDKVVPSSNLSHVLQFVAGVAALATGKANHFEQAVAAAKAGNREGVKQAVRAAFLPGMLAADQAIDQNLPGGAEAQAHRDRFRKGNSQQDLRLTAYGYAFGELISEGKFPRCEDAAAWLRKSIVAPAVTAFEAPKSNAEKILSPQLPAPATIPQRDPFETT